MYTYLHYVAERICHTLKVICFIGEIIFYLVLFVEC